MADSEPAIPAPRRPLSAMLLLVGGLLIFLVSFFWPGDSASRAAWTDEKAKAYEAASVRLHSLSQETIAAAGSNSEKELRAKIDKAEAEYKTIRSQLDAAIDRPKRIKLAIRICGTLMSIAGLLLLNRASK